MRTVATAQLEAPAPQDLPPNNTRGGGSPTSLQYPKASEETGVTRVRRPSILQLNRFFFTSERVHLVERRRLRMALILH
ncbi:hypothetical protein NDU88_009613 [Pleurodeles waltl]|uniref:Uncharacterized protein n=1 Tax=Pleurodeles waltl TaxID=8319 RepID=A0AAV7PWB4_PLEWA|nr:hypothetical protein NDU88_009613 [Pleurodeles waltl]